MALYSVENLISQYSIIIGIDKKQNQLYCSGKWLIFLNICSSISIVFCLF